MSVPSAPPAHPDAPAVPRGLLRPGPVAVGSVLPPVQTDPEPPCVEPARVRLHPRGGRLAGGDGHGADGRGEQRHEHQGLHPGLVSGEEWEEAEGGANLYRVLPGRVTAVRAALQSTLQHTGHYIHPLGS